MCERCESKASKRQKDQEERRARVFHAMTHPPPASFSAAPAAPVGDASGRICSVQPDAAARPADLQGTLKGPKGPLRRWPFRLLRDGEPVDGKRLGATGSVPEARAGLWLTDRNGRYRFAGVPPGAYRVEIVRPGVQLKAASPPAAQHVEQGHRADPLPALEHHAAESPELPAWVEVPPDFDR